MDQVFITRINQCGLYKCSINWFGSQICAWSMSDENLKKADSVILDWYDDDFEYKFSTQAAKVPIQTE